jgi:hypothetical protein
LIVYGVEFFEFPVYFGYQSLGIAGKGFLSLCGLVYSIPFVYTVTLPFMGIKCGVDEMQ